MMKVKLEIYWCGQYGMVAASYAQPPVSPRPITTYYKATDVDALLEGRAETEAGECPVCQGRGETVEQHPRTGEPTQVQCDPCYGTGKLPVEPSEVPRSLIEEAILVLDGAGDALGRFNGFQAEKCWPMAAKLRAALTKDGSHGS